MSKKLSNKLSKKFIACLMSAGFALASGAVAAKEYAIEIIVFDHPAEKTTDHEQWDFSSKRITERLAQMDALADKVSDHQTSDAVFSLEPVRLNLVESGYRILNTTSWQQPTSFYQDAPLIPLGDPETTLAAGFARVYTTSLIYADLHLQLSPLLSESESESVDFISRDVDQVVDAIAQQPHYFIAEKRRLKFKQIHYFDHPLFGAILGIWEVDNSLSG